MSAKHKKIKCPCGKGNVYTRGVCSACYQRIYRLVRYGDLTWRKAEKQGIVLKPPGRRANSGGRRTVAAESLGSPYAQ